ncbi:uncharacterized protein V1513DRAFT_450065 [Lipomyces chichibuensis]|uniref:uncharacterized protein n=1 Tax=Lipomyces chichibuensis TaxID=1546026 RepID=UPI003343DACC
MSREISGLKHSNSTLSLNTLPMWDSSDPDRHPPPLPLNPDPQILSGSPTRSSQLYGPTRSRTVSPVRQTMKPVTLNASGNDHSAEILHLLSKIHDTLKEVDATSKLSDATIRKSEKDVDSLLRRSKDNAVDLVSLRDKIYSTEIFLSHQLQDIHDIMSKGDATDSNSTVTGAISAGYLDELKKQRGKGSLSMNELLNFNRSQLDAIQSLNDAMSKSTQLSSEKLDCLKTQLDSIQETQVENTDEEKDSKVLHDLRRLLKLEDKSDAILCEIRKRERVTDGYIKDLKESFQQTQEMLTALSRSTMDDKNAIANQMHNVNATIASFRDQTQPKHDTAIADVIRSSQAQVTEILGRLQLDVKSRMQSVLSSLESNDRTVAAVEDLKSFIATRSDSSLESTIHEHEKLDQILKDIGALSSNMAPLSLLPEIHASFLESATQFNRYIIGEHSKLMSEVETLRQEKLDLVSELSALESVVATRSEQLEILEKRAENFQLRLTEHILQKSLKGATVTIEGRQSFQKSARPTLDVLSEAPGPYEANLANITNSSSVYTGHAIRENGAHEVSIISDASSIDASRSVSGGSARRRMSWSKKIGTMFSSGKENELVIPKRGGARKVGTGRSVSERL